ncbi:coenzyme F420-0:L-glutamate ligase [Candidatus Microgenomates bacterium]|nr:coenzyme F420-0:L-glutamate ligase [Candidatus Microgenomates bacterium]
MNVISIKTHKISPQDKLFDVINKYILKIEEKSIIVVASKIVAIAQGRVTKLTQEEKEKLIKKEADLYLPKSYNKHGLYITIKDNYLTYSAGIDESNANGMYVLWPKNPQEVANSLRSYLQKRYKIQNVGIIITDMLAIPLKWGVIGGAIAYSGFAPIKDLTGTKDMYGREFKYTRVGILHGLAAGAAVVMGEGAEQTPLGIITDVPFVEFQNHNPTRTEHASFKIDPSEDLYGPMLTAVPWKKTIKSK